MNVAGKELKGIHSLLLVNPSLGTREYTREDHLRTYLSLGTLCSALTDKDFINEFIRRSGSTAGSSNHFADHSSFDVRVLNLSLKPKTQTSGEFFETYVQESRINPVSVGMTATSAQLDEAREIGDAAARLLPRALLLIGGSHVSVSPSAFLRQTRFHAACMGDGVETFLEDLHDRDKNSGDLVYILAGTGCPHRCVFCAQNAIHQGRIRERSAENLFEEMKKLFEKGFRRFAMVQETFLRDPKRVELFCSRIENSGMRLEWTIEARADQLSREDLARMKRAGLRFVQLGAESGDQELLDSLGKAIHLKQVIRVRDWCEELGVDTAFYLLVGLPKQGWQSILRSAVFLKDHLPFNRVTRHISTAVAVPYPGTRIYEEKTVRLVNMPERSLNWPGRNCEVAADDEGAFLGRNFTETDEMVSEEIFEAYTCLDDYGHFLLQAKYNPVLSSEERLRSREFAWHAFHMIARRTIRDLIIRAQPDLSPQRYRRSREEILARDRGEEAHLKDLAPSAAPWPEIFTGFLAAVQFQNGFPTMKVLSIPNRIKFLKAWAVLWGEMDSKFSRIHFVLDSEEQGERLNEFLDGIPAADLGGFLERAEARKKLPSGSPDGILKIFGSGLEFERKDSVLEVRRIGVP